MKYYEEIWEAKEEGKEEGREEGRGEGKNLKLIHLVTAKMNMGQDVETIARDLLEEEQVVREILDAANACRADASPEDILQQMVSDRENQTVAV